MDNNDVSVQVERLKELLPDIFNADGKIDLFKLEQQLGNEYITKFKSENDRSAYEVVFHKNPLPMFIYDIESLAFLEVNEAAISNYGYSKKEFLSMTIKDIRPTEDMPLLLEKLKPENYKETDSDILRHLKKNGEIIYVQISAHFIDFEGRKARHILAHDITQERSWEKALHQRDYWLTESQKAGRIGSYSFKITEGYWKSSETLDEIFGIEKTEQKSFEEWANLIHPDDRAEMLSYFDEYVLTGKKQFNQEYRVLRPDGATLWVWGIGNLTFDDSGKPVKMMGTIQDITERKLAEETLKQTQRNYESFFNTIDDFLFVLDQKGDILHYNETVAKRLGYTDHELRGQSVMMVHPEDRREEAAHIVGEMLSGKMDTCPIPIMTKSGEQIPVETRITHGEWNGMPVLFGVAKDISKLQFSEEKFSKAFQLNSSACGLTNLEDGTYVEVNQAFCALFGYEKEEVIGKNPLDLGIFSTATRRAIQKHQTQDGKFANVPAELKTKNGEFKQVLLSAENIIIQSISYRYTEVNDITDQIHLMNALRGSEEKYRFLAENATDVIWSMDLSGKIDYISPSVFNLRGYTASETKNQSFSEIFAKDSITKASMLLATKAKLILSGERPEPVNIQLEQICKNGNTVWTEVLISATYNENGQFVQFQGVTRNIQEQKIAENSLRASEERFRLLAENSTDVIWTMDIDGRYNYISPSITKLRGYSVEEVAKQSFIDAVATNSIEDAKIMFHSLRSKILSGQKFDPQTLTIELLHKDGSTVWSEIVVDAICDKEGKFLHVLGITRNIDQRKKVEDALEESRARYRTLSDASFESIFVSQKGVCLEQNKTAELMFGYTAEEAIGRYGTDWIIPEDREMVMQNMISAHEQPYEATALRKDGTTFPCVLKGKMIKYKGKDVRITSLTDISTLKETENELRESREKYRLIFHNSPFGIISFDTTGKIIACNDNFVKIIGSTKEALVGLNMLDLPDQRVVVSVKKVLHGESDLIEGEYKSTTADKSTPVRAIYAPIINADGQIYGGVGIIEDITERVNAQKAQYESEEKYRLIFENSPLGIISFDTNGKVTACNSHFVNIIGSDTEKLIGLNMLNLPDKQIIKAVGNSLKGKIGLYEGDYQSVTASKMTPVRCTFSPICNLSGELSGGVGIIEDITERKLAEQEIQKIIHHYKSIIENAPDGIVLINAEGQFVDMSPSARRIFGYDDSDPVDIKPHEYTHPDDLPMVLYNLDKLIKDPSFVPTLEYRFRHRNGDWLWIESTFSNAFADPAVEAIIINFRDINDRKNNEAELIDSETKYRYLVEYSPDAIVIYIEGKIVFVNEAGVRLVAATNAEELIGKSVLDFVHPDSRALVIERMKQVLKVGSAVPIAEEVFLRLDGSTVEVDVKSMPIQYGDKRAAQLIIRDISEQKAAERAIQESEKRYKALFATSPSGITIVDEDGIILEINQEITNMTGYSREELVGQPIHILGPSDRVEFVKDNIRRILLGETLESEVVTIQKDGTQSFFYLRETAIILPNGRQGVLSVSNDITARKQVEDKLKESEDRYRTMIENSNDMIWTIDRNGNFLFLNEIASKTAGIELEDWRGKSFVPLLLVDDIPMITDIFHRTLNGEICSYELRLKQSDESIKTILTTTSPIIVNDKVEGIVSFGQDITDRKLADEILRESEQRFSDMAINSSGVVYQFFARKNGTSGFYYMSPKAEEMFGYSPDLNSSDWNLGEHIYAEDKDAFVNAIGQALAQVEPLDFECRVITSVGVKWIQILSRPTLKNDEVVFNGIMIDVTERKQTQELLEKSREEFKTLFDKAPIGYHEIDKEGKIVRINEAELKMFGRTSEEMIGQEFWNFVVNKDESKTAAIAKLSGEMQPLEMYERELVSKDGTVLNVLMKDRILKDDNGEILGIQTTVQNITIRKKTEVALRVSQERLNTLIEASPDFICFKDDIGRWQIANKAADELFCLQNIDYIGKTDKELSELTQPFFKHVHLDCIESDLKAWTYGKAYNVEEVVPQPNGLSRVYDVIKIPLFKENGDRKALIVLGREISERKKIENELRKSEKKYSELFTQMLDGFALHEIICDEAGEPVDYRFLDVNPAFEKQTGLKAKDIIGKTVLEVMPRTELIWIQLYGEVALTGHPTTFDNISQEIGKHFQVNVFSPVPRQFACLVSDITERKNAEATIRDYQANLETLVKERTHELMVRETYLSAIVDNHPGMFWMKDDKGKFIFSNRANSKFLRLAYGESAEEIIGKTDFDFCPPYQARTYQREDNDVAKMKKEITSEDAMIVGTKEYWFEKLKFPVIDTDSNTIGVAGYSIDITERIKRDARLRMQSEAFESFALTIVITNKDGIIEWANPAFEKLTGYRIKEVVGEKANMLRSGKMPADFYKDLWSTVLEGKVWTGEFLNKRKDGSLYYEESTITPVRDREGMISHFIALKTNITHRKEMEEALRISDERWQFAIEGSGDGVYDTDLIQQKQFYSPQWKSMLGYNESEIGDTMDEWNSRIHPDDVEHAISEFNNYLAGGTNTYNNEHRLRCKNGSYKWVLTRGKIVERNENGAPTRLIGTLTDITEIKLLEESLRRNIEKERELNDIKSRFVATASHEFRTPLASILITNDTLMNYWHRLEENQIDAKLQKIKSNVLFLTNIVNDVMQLSKIQEGKLEFNPLPLDVVALCNEIVNEFKEEQLQNPVEFVCALTSLNLNLDVRLMRQTFNNLLSNASKYSHGSTPIHIELKVENNEMLFSVQDHGIGIPTTDQKRLFTPFFRASNSKMIQGNGLGLNIILEAAKMHGGDITFESTPNVGSTFVLHIPITSEN